MKGFLLRVELDLAKMAHFARRMDLPPEDVNYCVHGVLRANFGTNEPKPFRVEPPKGGMLPVYGYTTASGEELLKHAELFADPESFAIMDLKSIVTKPMPRFESGMTLGYETIICPTSRGRDANGKWYERDFHEVASKQREIPKEQAYIEWFKANCARWDVPILESRVENHTVLPLHRRTQGKYRASRWPRLPLARITGSLRVQDPARFTEWLMHGVGRHRSFGVGMISLKPIEHSMN